MTTTSESEQSPTRHILGNGNGCGDEDDDDEDIKTPEIGTPPRTAVGAMMMTTTIATMSSAGSNGDRGSRSIGDGKLCPRRLAEAGMDKDGVVVGVSGSAARNTAAAGGGVDGPLELVSEEEYSKVSKICFLLDALDTCIPDVVCTCRLYKAGYLCETAGIRDIELVAKLPSQVSKYFISFLHIFDSYDKIMGTY